MKRNLALILVLSVLFLICGCAKTSVRKNADVTLSYIYGEDNINVTLTDDEAQKVIEILSGNSYEPVFSGVHSCGFDKNVSLKAGGRTFAIALDTCNCIQDLGTLRYFDIPEEDMEYIHSLFEKYGGSFHN